MYFASSINHSTSIILYIIFFTFFQLYHIRNADWNFERNTKKKMKAKCSFNLYKNFWLINF